MARGRSKKKERRGSDSSSSTDGDNNDACPKSPQGKKSQDEASLAILLRNKHHVPPEKVGLRVRICPYCKVGFRNLYVHLNKCPKRQQAEDHDAVVSDRPDCFVDNLKFIEWFKGRVLLQKRGETSKSTMANYLCYIRRIIGKVNDTHVEFRKWSPASK